MPKYVLVGERAHYDGYIGRETYESRPDSWKTFIKTFSAKNDREAKARARKICRAPEREWGQPDIKVKGLYRISHKVRVR